MNLHSATISAYLKAIGKKPMSKKMTHGAHVIVLGDVVMTGLTEKEASFTHAFTKNILDIVKEERKSPEAIVDRMMEIWVATGRTVFSGSDQERLLRNVCLACSDMTLAGLLDVNEGAYRALPSPPPPARTRSRGKA